MDDAGTALGVVIYLGLLVLMIASVWKVYSKAGQPGWAVLIPFYNVYILLKVAGKPGWWLILMFIPLVNLVITVLTTVGVAKNFHKGGGFAVGLVLLPVIFYPILGFGDARYVGSAS